MRDPASGRGRKGTNMTGPLFRIVVADDEVELLEAICKMIDWESIGFILVGSANNGLDALQMVEQYQPDLLLTDIEMPRALIDSRWGCHAGAQQFLDFVLLHRAVLVGADAGAGQDVVKNDFFHTD